MTSGEGYAIFSIRPKAGLGNGVAIHNQAGIVFDVNPPIATNVVTNTIDTDPPTSTVGVLPATSLPTFTLSWSGSDGSGSGVAFYDVYTSTDGGPFALWLSGITQTSALYTGTVGSTYGFYSIATDNVGYRQSTPSAAQASTTTTTTSAMKTRKPRTMSRRFTAFIMSS